MKFTIITPTYNRPNKLAQSVNSVLNQAHQDFKILIVNDSPECDYSDFEGKYLQNEKVIYFKNKENSGVNFSRNFALSEAKKLGSDYIIFLDDDDWLHIDALEKINSVLEKENPKWLVTNRTAGEQNLTKVKEKKQKYNYFWDMLMLRNIYGDATHTIKTSEAVKYKFAKHVKNGEELYYFSQLPFEFIYQDINATDSNGYTANGLTDMLKNKYKENTENLWRENLNWKMFIYMILRTLKTITK